MARVRNRKRAAVATVFVLSKAIETSPTSVGSTKFIAIDGHGGAGKTTFANWLGSELSAEVVRLDDFASQIHETDIAALVVEQIFEPIKAGASKLNYMPQQFWEDHVPEPVVDKPVTDVMILEGVGSTRPQLRPYLATSIFIDTKPEVAIERGIARDLKDTNLSEDELRPIWQAWVDKEVHLFKQQSARDYADFLLNPSEDYERQIAI